MLYEQISCLKDAARNVTSEEDCFDLDKHLDKLWTFKEHTFSSAKYSWLKQSAKEDLIAFIGRAYFRGLYGMNHHNIELLFKYGIGPDIFGATISQQQIRFLLAHIAFDENSTRKD